MRHELGQRRFSAAATLIYVPGLWRDPKLGAEIARLGMVRLCTTRVALTVILALPHAGGMPQFNHAR